MLWFNENRSCIEITTEGGLPQKDRGLMKTEVVLKYM